jgi:putative oxidoreductase
MSTTFIDGLKGPYSSILKKLTCYGAPIMDLVVRLWLARVFFRAGLTKIDDWENTLFLFEVEYMVPVLPVNIAAFLATVSELGMSSLLVIGLASRLAALPLLGMALVIQFALGATNPAYDHVEHFYWMILLLLIIVRGPGLISIDHLIKKKFSR